MVIGSRDGAALARAAEELLTTRETLANAEAARRWLRTLSGGIRLRLTKVRWDRENYSLL